MAKQKRKTGDKPLTRQPLKIDRLPVEMWDRIQAERSAGRTWMEIEEMSPTFKEWERVPDSAKKLFPDGFLPHSNLARWWDLRVEQVRREVEARSVKARELAVAFTGPGIEGLPEAVRNALGDQIFALMQSAEKKDQAEFRKELLNFGFLLAQWRKLEIQDKKAEAESKRVAILERAFEMKKRKFEEETDKAARKLGKGQQLTVEDINRIRERTFGLPPVQRSAASSHPAA